MDYQKIMENIKDEILWFMGEKQLTIFEMAEESGVSEETIKYILYKHPQNCKMSTLMLLSNAMNITIDQLIKKNT
jgi:hypothetical protein